MSRSSRRTLVSHKLRDVSTGNPDSDRKLNEWRRDHDSQVFEKIRYFDKYTPDHEIAADEIDAGVVPVNFQYPPGHLYRYGTNTTPGTTDMSDAFVSAGAASLTPYVPGDRILVTTGVDILDNQHWTLDGSRFEISGTSLIVFTANSGVDDWSLTGDWSVTGDNQPDGSDSSGTCAAVRIIDAQHWRVEGLTAIQIRGWGLIVQPTGNTSTRGEHGQIIAFQAYGCYRGLETEAGTGAEYISVVAPNIARCNIGIRTAAGNTNVVGGSITDCDVCVEIAAGSNHAHGIFSGVNINHAVSFAVRCALVTNGQSFDGCHIYGEGAIWFEQSKGITFNGGHMDCPLYCYKGSSSGINIIRNMYCPGGYGLRRLLGTNDGHDELIIMGCFGQGVIAGQLAGDGVDATGINMNDPSMCFVHAKRAAGSTQSLTSGVGAVLIFNTEVSDRRRIYDNTTGITTIPSPGTPDTGLYGLRGVYRVSGTLVFSGTAMGATTDYVEIQINGTGKRIFKPVVYSTTKLVVPVETVISLADGDAVKLFTVITGTTPVHGDSAYESELTLQRLSA